MINFFNLEKYDASEKIVIRRIIILIHKMCSRARWKVSAGRTLPTPALGHRFLTVERVQGVCEDHKSKFCTLLNLFYRYSGVNQ